MYNPFANNPLADQAVLQHPSMRQILADVEEEKRVAAIAAQQAQIEEHNHRKSTIQGLKNQLTQELAVYNQLAQQVRRSHGKMHILQEKLDTLLGVHSPVMPDSFLKINLPVRVSRTYGPATPTLRDRARGRPRLPTNSDLACMSTLATAPIGVPPALGLWSRLKGLFKPAPITLAQGLEHRVDELEAEVLRASEPRSPMPKRNSKTFRFKWASGVHLKQSFPRMFS